MKIFLDSADITAIRLWATTGLIDGVTTNPTHLSKFGGQSPTQLVKEICELLPAGEISVEVTEDEPETAYEQAKKIAALANNILVKIPCHQRYYAIIKRLVDEGIAINVTLVFNLMQGMLMSKLGVAYISPFVGRLDDIDSDGSQLLYELCAMAEHYQFSTKILAASLRSPRHLHQAIDAGADAATLPIDLFEKITKHPLTEAGIKQFTADWQKLGVKTFP